MTTAIGTVEDLIRVLDDDPELLEALRARLLTRELLEMPNILAQFAAKTDRQFGEVNRRLDGNDRRFDGVDARFDGVDARFDGVDVRLDDMGRAIQRLQDDMGILKGAHARNVAQRDYGWMTRNMGLQPLRLLPVEEVDELALKLRETGVSRSDRESFRNADMIIEAADELGATVYIAAEVSFTVDERDTGRAIRNSQYLTRVTGKPARAAVIGSALDDRVRALIDSGEVYWRQFSDRNMQVD